MAENVPQLTQVDQQIRDAVTTAAKAEVKSVQKAVRQEQKHPSLRPEVTPEIKAKAEQINPDTVEGKVLVAVQKGIDAEKAWQNRKDVSEQKLDDAVTLRNALIARAQKGEQRSDYAKIGQAVDDISSAKEGIAQAEAALAGWRGGKADKDLADLEEPLRATAIEGRAQELAAAHAMFEVLLQGQEIDWTNDEAAQKALAQLPVLSSQDRIKAQVLRARMKEGREKRFGAVGELADITIQRYGSAAEINEEALAEERANTEDGCDKLNQETARSFTSIEDIRLRGVRELKQYVDSKKLSGDNLTRFLQSMGITKIPAEGDVVVSTDATPTTSESIRPEEYFAAESPYDQMIIAQVRTEDHDRLFAKAMKDAEKNDPVAVSQALQLDLRRSMAHHAKKIIDNTVTVIFANANEKEIKAAQDAVKEAKAKERALDRQKTRALIGPAMVKALGWTLSPVTRSLQVIGIIAGLGGVVQDKINSSTTDLIDATRGKVNTKLESKVAQASSAVTNAEQWLTLAKGGAATTEVKTQGSGTITPERQTIDAQPVTTSV